MKINYKCKVCNKEFKNATALTSHLNSKHSLSSKTYYDKYLKKDYEGICPICGKITRYTRLSTGYKKFCSIKCSRQSEEVLNNIRNGMKNSEHWQQVLKSEEYRKSLSESISKATNTVEIRKKRSDITTKLIHDGICACKYKYDNIKFSSSYELAYYIWLKDNNINFIYQADSIPFDFYGVTKHYVPDFKINDRLVEIKGIHFFENKNTNGKMICPWKHKNDTPEKIKLRNELFEAKHQCMIRNNVEIITDCSKYIEYVETKYGKNFFKEHKIKK